MNYINFKNEFENVTFKDKRVLMVSDNFDETINKLNKLGKENNIEFTYSQSGNNSKEDTIYVSMSKKVSTDIRIIHINSYIKNNIKGITYDYTIFDTINNIQYDKCYDNIDFTQISIYNKGFVKINGIEIPELSSFEVYLKKNDNENDSDRFIGIAEVKIYFINHYIDNLILDNKVINIYSKYNNSNEEISINNCKPIFENKGVNLFELDASKDEFVEKTYKFKFYLKDLKFE